MPGPADPTFSSRASSPPRSHPSHRLRDETSIFGHGFLRLPGHGCADARFDDQIAAMAFNP
jgi:hypothetical protein